MPNSGNQPTVDQRGGQTAVPSPVRTAAIAAVGFVFVASCYIVVSDGVATRIAKSPSEMETIQHFKGIGFMVVMGGAIFVLLRALLGRIRRMEAKIAAQHEALLRSERRAMAGILAASVAHDINNVLTGLNVDLMLISETVRDEPGTREVLDRVEKSYEQLAALSKRLVAAGRDSAPGGFAMVGLRELLDDCVRVARINTRERRSRFEIEGADIVITANAAVLRQLFVNLFLNAVEAAPGDARVLVRIARAENSVVVSVHDDGPGIPAEVAANLFKPFATTKANGNGLGLVSVRACAQMHGGRVELAPAALAGACFAVMLPLDCSHTPAPPTLDA